MNIGYLIYQAERPISRAEQCAADTRKGELAAGLSRLLRRGRSRWAAPATAAAPLPVVPDCACALDAFEPDRAPAR